MRILLACVRYPPAPGGAETHVRALAEGFVARGHDVEVHTTNLFKEVPFTPRAQWPDDPSVTVVRHAAYTPGSEMHYTLSPAMARALARRAPRFDVVHAHSYGYFQTVAGAFAAGVAGKPFVFTPHFHPPWSMEGGAKRRRLRAVYDATISKFVMRRADAIIGVSTGELAEMERVVGYDAAKTTVIPNGINPSRFTPIPDGKRFRQHYALGEAPLVVYAGRLAVNKGLHHLLEAFPTILRAQPDARLVLAGEDQDQGPRLHALAKHLGVESRVLFTGQLPEDLYLSALGAADVFVLPSEWEAFGIVLAEAMACERACVATRVGGAPDVVVDGETGFIVEYGDAAALGERVARLLADAGLREKMGKEGRKRALARFTWDAVVEETLGLYERLKASRSP